MICKIVISTRIADVRKEAILTREQFAHWQVLFYAEELLVLSWLFLPGSSENTKS